MRRPEGQRFRLHGAEIWAVIDFLESSEHEPAEPDPEADLPNPEEELVPEIETAESDVPRDLLRTFWLLVLVVNVGVFAVALGIIWLVFVRDVVTSVGLALVGVVLLGGAYRHYRQFRLEDPEDPYGEDSQ